MTQPAKFADTTKIHFSWDYVAKLDLPTYNKLPRPVQEQLARWMIENMKGRGKQKK